jgi:hypothetical protein
LGLFLRTDLGGGLWVTRGELGDFEGVILGADLGLYGAHFASGMKGMLGKNYGMLEKVSRVARCISKLAYKCMRQ